MNSFQHRTNCWLSRAGRLQAEQCASLCGQAMPGLHLLNHLGQRHLQGRLGANLLWPRQIFTNPLDAIYTMIPRRRGFVVFMAPPESLGSAISFTEWTMRSGQYCNRCGMSMSDCTQTRNAHFTSPWLTCSDRGCVDPGLLIVVLTFSLPPVFFFLLSGC